MCNSRLQGGFTRTLTLTSLRAVLLLPKKLWIRGVDQLIVPRSTAQPRDMPKLVCGFTLIEMMISIGIFLIISSIVLANYNGFNTHVLLTNLAYDVALTVRQAQVYGISVRESSTGVAKPYGVYFKDTFEDGSGEGTTNYFILFTDLDYVFPPGTSSTDEDYDGTSACLAGSECIGKYSTQRGNKINRFCVYSGASSVCSDTSGTVAGASLDSLNILFIRPNPDALFNPVFDALGPLANIDRATVDVISPQGIQKTVTITNTGQISVN